MVNLWEFNKGRYKVNNSFSQNIKMIRKDYGLTQEELGNILGLTKVQISYYERGISHPKLDFILQFAEYFDLPLNQIIEVSNCSNFYFREVVTQEGIYIDNIPTNNGKESLSGIAGLIKNPMFRKSKELEKKYYNFMLLVPELDSEIANFFYKNLYSLPQQSLSTLDNYNAWCVPSSNTTFYDGYPLLYQLLWVTNKGSWLRSAVAKPATNKNILALVLPQNDEIIRLFILPEKEGCKLHASRSPELQEQIELWLKKDVKERHQVAREYCLQILHEKSVEQTLNEQQKEKQELKKLDKYSLEQFLKNRELM